MSTTTMNPLERRAQLEAEQENTSNVFREAGRRRQHLKDAIKAEEQKLDEVRVSAARAGDLSPVAPIEASIAGLRRDLAGADDEQDVAKRASARVEQELRELLHKHLDAFAEDIEPDVQEAIGALRRLEGAYREAAEAWDTASQRWRPIIRAVPKVRSDNAAARGVLRPALTYPPAFPLPHPRTFFARLGSAELAPRPREITNGTVEQPKPLAVFRHIESEHEESVDIASPAFDRLSASEDWARIDDGAEVEAEAAPEIRASGAARWKAKQLGVDLNTVEGTGYEGHITKADVEKVDERRKALIR